MSASRILSRLVAVGAALALTAVSGCAPEGGTPSGTAGGGGSGEATTVNIWGWMAAEGLWQKVEDRMKAQGVEVDITYRATDPQQYGAVLQTAISGGQGPDIFPIGASAAAPYKFVDAAQLEEIDDFVDLSAFKPDYLSYARIDDKHYGVPFALWTMQMFYNTEVFARYNISEPQTWDELIAICDKLQSEGIVPIAAQGQGANGQAALTWMMEAMAPSLLGADWINKLVTKEVDFTDPRFVDLLAKMQSLTKYFPKNWAASGAGGTEMQTMVATGKAAMTMTGLWDVGGNFAKINPDLKVGQFMIPPPNAGGKPQMDWIVDGVFAMSSGLKGAKAEAAKKILAYTATPEFAQLWMDTFPGVSALPGVKADPEPPSVTETREILEAGEGTPVDLFGTGSPLMQPPLSSGSEVAAAESVQSVNWTTLPLLMSGELTPEEAAKKFQEKLSWFFK